MDMNTKKLIPFELFMGCLGNGVTCCNRVVIEHGDYQNICHISPEGKVTWYYDPEQVPIEARNKIWQEAKRSYTEFEQYLGGMTELAQYAYLLDHAPHAAFMHVVDMKNGTLNDKISYLKNVMEESSTFPKEVLSFRQSIANTPVWKIWYTKYDFSGNVRDSGVLPFSFINPTEAHETAKRQFDGRRDYSWIVSQVDPRLVSDKKRRQL